ncbi:mitochondrial carrier protein, putative [Bodo saltans]|uniref:ADP/ATP translocase n=1 Tax=Bodo saltans TaxID=75058 RepID=A0A0S4J2G4_BODSA|nr:mitochondrial carrier protein, putative [Bodo saltans]|eukprot:CUG84802.1 mitochondrial carrier protein, putative [Bodo saltans]
MSSNSDHDLDRMAMGGDDDFPMMAPPPPMGATEFMLQLAIHGAFSFGRRVLLAPVTRVATLLTVEGELVRQGRIVDEGKDGQRPGFDGIIGCIKHIYIREGPYGYFRGVWTEAVASVPCTIIEEMSSSLVSSAVEAILGERAAGMPQISLLLWSIAASAAVAQISSVVHDPTQTVVTCLLGDTIPAPVGGNNGEPTSYKFSGARAATKAIYQRHGLKGFFRGVSLAAGASVAYRGSYYLLLHLFLSNLSREAQTAYGIWFARILAVVAGLVAQPIEVVRRRLMLTAGEDEPPYKGVVDCVRTIVRTEGVATLWSGFRVRMLFTLAGFALTVVQDFVSRPQSSPKQA